MARSLRRRLRRASSDARRPEGGGEGAARTVAVLAYHKIGPPSAEAATPYSTPVDVFRAQLETLRAGGWTVVGINDLLRGLASPRSLPERSALLTFDDGYRSVLELASPVLLEFGFPAVVFVPTDYVGRSSTFDSGTAERPEPVCNLAELRELEAAGVSVQSHGAGHVRLSSQSPSEVEEELHRSKAELEDGLGKPVEAFAFPYGDPGQRAVVAPALTRAGYRAAFLYDGAPFRLPAVDHYELPRLPIEPETDVAVELRRVIRSDLRRHLERATAARWRSIAQGQLDAETVTALDGMLARYTLPTSNIIWIEPGLQPVRLRRKLIPFPSAPRGPSQLFASGKTGSQAAPWIAPGYAYEFRLRIGVDHAATVTVVSDPPSAEGATHAAPSSTKSGSDVYITAVPNPAPLEGTHATTTISWSTGYASTGEVELTAYPIGEDLPEEDSDAVAALERLRLEGGEFLLIPHPCRWWLELYPGLERHLSDRFPVVGDTGPGLLYDLRAE